MSLTDQSPSTHTGADPAKRARLLAAAAREFARHGFDRTSVDVIAERAGIGKGTVYLYFPSKAALFQSVLLELQDQLGAVPLVGGVQDPRVALRTFIRAQLQLADALPDYVRCYTSALFGVNRDFQEAALAIFAWQEGILDGLLQRARAEPDAVRRKRRAALFTANLLSAALIRGLRDAGDADTALEQRALLDGFLAGG
ncbi:MAG: TetR/AcrR family transcriptional regulator [Dehalococcoidia bacterium]